MRAVGVDVWRRTGRVAFLVLLATLASHPALAQVDLAGMWQTIPRNQDGSGMTGDAAGVPLSQEGRWWADHWSPEDFDVAEWVCRPHSWDYGLEAGRSRMRLWTEVERATQRLIAIHGHNDQEEQEVTIWMDGRPHPPENALHSWGGFSTGEWEGGRARRDDHACQGRVYPSLGADAERSDDGAHAVEAHWSVPAGDHDHVRPPYIWPNRMCGAPTCLSTIPRCG